MKIKISQIWSKIVKKWMTACDFLTGGQARTNSYRWLSRRIYGRETRVIKTRGGDRYILSCNHCPMGYMETDYEKGLIFHCNDRDTKETNPGKSKKILTVDPACELHFRTPILFQILPVILAVIGVAAIIWLVP